MALNNNAININAGFELGSGQPIDSRQLLTKAQMLSIDENIMPSKYFCVCSDDGLLYTYDVNNEVDEELGKFRVASGLEVIRLTQAEYNQMVEDGEIEDKFYLIIDAPNPSAGGASNALELAYDNTTSELNAINVQDAIDELNIKSENKLDKVESMPAAPSNGDTVLFLGTTTDSYTKGHIYQYQTNEWVDLSPEEGIDEEARETATAAMALATTANEKAEEANTKATNAQTAINEVNAKVENISQDASGISYDNTTSGLTAEDVQNAIDEVNVKVDNIPKAVVPKGTVAFANLPELTNIEVGWMYNISDDFTTTSDFVTSGISEKAGSNVYCIEVSGTKKWDVFAATEDIVVDTEFDTTSNNPIANSTVATDIETRLKKAATIPATPSDGDTVLFIGTTTSNYTNGHIYQYQTNNWVDVSATGFQKTIQIDLNDLMPADYNNGIIYQASNAAITGDDLRIRKGHFYTVTDNGEGVLVWEEIVLGATYASGISYDNTNSGLAAVNTQYAIDEVNEKTDTKLDKVTTIPATPSDGDTVLFIGTNTNDYKKGHTYQYQTNEWVDITATEEELVSGAIGLAQVANEKAEEAITTISNKLDKATIVTQAEYNQLIEDGEIEDKFYIISDADSSGESEIKDASDVDYDNTSSGLTATDTQAAIDELNTKVNNIPDAVVPKGTVAFASLPSLASVEVGWMYNISDDFTTTSDFVTLGVSEKAGSNVYCIEIDVNGTPTKKWDVFAVTDSIVVDQTYSATSTNPQSGTAVAQAIAGLSGHYTISYSNGIATLTAI